MSSGRRDAEWLYRLDYVIGELSQHSYNAAAIPGFRSHQALARGDRAAAAALMLEAARGWDEERQLLYALSARLRHAQLVRDQPKVEALRDQLRDLGVGDPEGYATVLAGPAPPP